MIEAFGSLPAALAAHPTSQERCLSDRNAARLLAAARTLSLRTLEREALDGPIFPTTAALIDYLHAGLAFSPVEQLRALFLDTHNRLILDEVLCSGTVNESALFPREIIRRALDVNATGLILLHNHPSGDHEPSEADIRMTRNLARGLREINVTLHDHLIIGRAGWKSLRAEAIF